DGVRDLEPTAIAMEACASAHYWARCWLAAGREVRLINPRFVKPFVKGSKNDAVDAEAIFEAAMRPTMRFVPVKSTDQQDLQSLHRARDRLICQRTAFDQSYPRPPRRIRGRSAARSMALYGAGTDCHRRCRPVGPGTSNLRRAHGPTRRPGSPDPEARRDDRHPLPHERDLSAARKAAGGGAD